VELERFLDRYGHRAVYEADMLNPRWAEDPSYVLDQVRLALADGAALAVRGNAERIAREAEAEIRSRSRLRAPLVMWLARQMRAATAAREHGKSALVASVLPARRLVLDIGRRLALEGHLDRPEDVLHLSVADVACWLHGWWDGSGARALAGDRARQREAWLSEEAPPDVVTEGVTPDPRSPIPGPRSSIPDPRGVREWSGIAAAPGVARGRARVVHHPHDSDHFKSGEVLVAPSTDPGWTPLFLRAAAIVMETGGYLSHGAIVARELGIPAVVNIPGVLREISDGDVLTVDGDGGRVTKS
jgi:pyruvate,water dikinase